MQSLRIGNRLIGPGHPCYIIAEIGNNHNGDVRRALDLMEAMKEAGVDAVKFQARTIPDAIPESMRGTTKETPWGTISYEDYRRKLELGKAGWMAVADMARHLGLDWFASCWDIEALKMIDDLNPVAHKVASPCLTDDDLLIAMRGTGRPVFLSTGMSTDREIRHAIDCLDHDRLAIAHCNSSYPSNPSEINLKCMANLWRWWELPTGYSGHEGSSLYPTIAAVALGASFVERHVTLSRTMWGTDQASSLEPDEVKELVKGIREVEASLGDGVKRVYDGELSARKRLRHKQYDCELAYAAH